MFQDQNLSRRLTRNILWAFATAAGIFFIWTVGTSTRRPAPVVEQIVPQAAPRILSAADTTSMLLANYYPSHVGAGGAALGNESLLKIVANPTGAGFVPQAQALAQIERDALERLAKPGWHPIHPEKYIRPIFPERYAESIEVASQACKVRSKPLGANASSTAAVAGDGSLIYADAFPGCDIVYRSSALKTEEFIVLRDNRAQAEWSWELDCGAALTPRLTPMNSLEFVDGKGVPRLRINAPEGKDAAGKLLRVGEQLALKLDGNQITLTANLEGCKYPAVIDPTWTSTGNMAQARTYSDILLLNTGKVLIAGGVDYVTGPFSSCELYDPGSGTWSTTGSMSIGRSLTFLTLLTNGKVLATSGGAYTTVCELYDPSTGVWSGTGSFVLKRSEGTVTLLSNGQVLVAGGEGSSNTGILSECELYDPSSGLWTVTGSLGLQREAFTCTPLSNGMVLAAGGLMPGSGTVPECELYDPLSGLWTVTGSLSSIRANHSAVLLVNGDVMVSGGQYAGQTSEIYDVTQGTWSAAGSTVGPHQGNTPILPLSNGNFLYVGTTLLGSVNAPPLNTSLNCEYYNVNTGVWNSAGSLSRQPVFNYLAGSMACALPGGAALNVGGTGVDSNLQSVVLSTCEVFNPKSDAQPQTISLHFNTSAPIVLSGTTVASPITYALVQSPIHGVISGTVPNLVYTPNAFFSGSDSLTFTVTDTFYGTSLPGTVSINVTNISPTVLASASPATLIEGQSVSFAANGADLDGDPISYSWDFGDGSASTTEQNPAHPYLTGGIYTAVVTVTDSLGATSTSSVVIHVISHSELPTARFTTSEVVAFVGLPFTFDASFSTDPGNNIVQYKWSFGDGSPDGSGQVISKIYNQAGPITASLTVVTGAGLTDTISRVIEVLPANEIGLFNSQIDYTVKWDRGHANADSLTLSAVLNVGTAQVGAGSAVALEVVGQRFTGTLDGKFRDFSNPNSKWQVKANIRGKPFGEVTVKITLKHASLGLGFNQAGVLATADLHDVVTMDIPIHIEIAGRTFDVPISTDFKFRKGGTAATGNGTGP